MTMSQKYPDFCLPCLGLHPVQGDPGGEQRSVRPDEFTAALPLIEKYHEALVAIGEVG